MRFCRLTPFFILLLLGTKFLFGARRTNALEDYSDDDDDDEDYSDYPSESESEAENSSASAEAEGGPENEEDESLVQANPNYISVNSDEEDESDFNDEEDEKTGDQKRKQAKRILSNSMSKNRTTVHPSASNQLTRRRRALKFLKKHSFKITILLTAVAFRKEIKAFIWKVCTKPMIDPKTGKTVRVPITISPTSIVKVLVFVDIMRRLQSASQQQRENGPSALLAMLILGRSHPALSIFLSKLLAPSNSAYVPPIEQHFTLENINDRYSKDSLALQKAMYGDGPSKEGMTVQISKTNRTSFKQMIVEMQRKNRKRYNETVILLDLTGMDSSASQLGILRDKVSFLISEYRSNGTFSKANESIETVFTNTDNNAPNEDNPDRPTLEVVVLLESPGGSASDYALASEQILRLRKQGIRVTICVDKVAASGGYMIACTSSPGRLFAAPFAVLGSIGVIGQAVNVQRALKGWGIEPLVFRGGKDKAPVGLIGEVTRDGMAKVQRIVDNTHQAFKRHVAVARPVLADRIEDIATGDIWLGYDALENGLIDRIISSDEYIGERLQHGAQVLKLVQVAKPKYPFSRPTTAGSLFDRIRPSSRVLLSDLLSEFQACAQKSITALKGLLSDDNSGLNLLTTSFNSVSARSVDTSHGC